MKRVKSHSKIFLSPYSLNVLVRASQGIVLIIFVIYFLCVSCRWRQCVRTSGTFGVASASVRERQSLEITYCEVSRKGHGQSVGDSTMTWVFGDSTTGVPGLSSACLVCV